MEVASGVCLNLLRYFKRPTREIARDILALTQNLFKIKCQVTAIT